MKTKEQKLKELAEQIKDTKEYKLGYLIMMEKKYCIGISTTRMIFTYLLPSIIAKPVDGLLINIDFSQNKVHIKIH